MSTTERGKIHRRKIYEVNVVDRRGESKEETDEMGERGEMSRNELHLQGECGEFEWADRRDKNKSDIKTHRRTKAKILMQRTLELQRILGGLMQRRLSFARRLASGLAGTPTRHRDHARCAQFCASISLRFPQDENSQHQGEAQNAEKVAGAEVDDRASTRPYPRHKET